MVTNARGELYAPLTISRCRELNLPHQVDDSTSMLGTRSPSPLTNSKDAPPEFRLTTRAATLRHLADPDSKPEDFGRPDTYIRSTRRKRVCYAGGHTEAAIDLARLAGLQANRHTDEILHPDGTMARLPQLREADEWGLSSFRYAISSPTACYGG